MNKLIISSCDDGKCDIWIFVGCCRAYFTINFDWILGRRKPCRGLRISFDLWRHWVIYRASNCRYVLIKMKLIIRDSFKIIMFICFRYVVSLNGKERFSLLFVIWPFLYERSCYVFAYSQISPQAPTTAFVLSIHFYNDHSNLWWRRYWLLLRRQISLKTKTCFSAPFDNVFHVKKSICF